MSIPISTAPAFRRHDTVVAAEDLPGVPRGTRGRVMYVAGMTWIRYRVRFDNGAELGSLDTRHLASVQDWEREQVEAEREAQRAERERLAEELRAKVVETPAAH